jgi:hypothetical protein
MQFLHKRAFGQIILFFIVALLSILLFSTTTYVPYVKPATYARYEGFTDPSGGEVDPSGNTAEKAPPSILQSMFGGKSEGFTPLQPSRDLQHNQVIDKFSQVSDNSTGDNQCVSAGLSNSKGPLCLTPELIDLLKTRGNNM